MTPTIASSSSSPAEAAAFPSPSPSPPLTLRALVAACVSAGVHAGVVIREVVAGGHDLGLVNKAADDTYDPQTVADRRSQQRLIYALRRLWPELRIVGEEGELAAPATADLVQAELSALPAELFGAHPEPDAPLDPTALVLWVDPLDGTKKFAAREFHEVSVLLGIAYHGRPLAGVLHLPFADNAQHGGDVVTYWGGPGIGVYKTIHGDNASTKDHHTRLPPHDETNGPNGEDQHLRIMVSGTNCPRVNAALTRLAPREIENGGATGTMVLSVLTGRCDAFFRFRNATKRWDICALEPLLEALGGRLVDKRGRQYHYDPAHDGSEYDNPHGLVATLRPAVETRILATMDEVEVLRTIDGRAVMTPEWFHAHVFPTAQRVLRCDVRPGSIHRGKQSTVARLRLELLDKDAQVMREQAVFLKRYARSELPPRAERNWQRDLQSYRTEARFYDQFHAHLRPFVSLLEPLAVVFDRDAAGRETGEGFLVLLEDVLATGAEGGSPGSPQLVTADSLGRKDTEMVLGYLARLHAAALTSPGLMARVRTDLWPTGAWWSLAKRGGEELARAPGVWSGVLESFTDAWLAAGHDEVTPALRQLGERMVTHAAYISDELFGAGSERFAAYKTLIHGDTKSANFFFEATTRAVTGFDWQWTGLGLGVLDVANLLNTSVGIEALTVPDGETALLRFYYEAFVRALAEGDAGPRDVATEYPFAALERHYRLATMEYARVLIANFWAGMTPATCAADAHRQNWGLGYRSVPHVLRLIEKLDDGLAMVERERAGHEEGDGVGPL